MKAAFKLPSAAYLLQRYSFFLFYGFFTCFFALFKKKSKDLEGFMS